MEIRPIADENKVNRVQNIRKKSRRTRQFSDFNSWMEGSALVEMLLRLESV